VALDRSTVRRIAALARIRVGEEELDTLSGELSGILGWVEQLNEVPTDGVAPMASVADMTLAQREDRVADGDCREDVLANAPDRAGDFYAVPKVVE